MLEGTGLMIMEEAAAYTRMEYATFASNYPRWGIVPLRLGGKPFFTADMLEPVRMKVEATRLINEMRIAAAKAEQNA